MFCFVSDQYGACAVVNLASVSGAMESSSGHDGCFSGSREEPGAPGPLKNLSSNFSFRSYFQGWSEGPPNKDPLTSSPDQQSECVQGL